MLKVDRHIEYNMERKINEALHELLTEKRFLITRQERLKERKEQILHDLYTARAGRSVENPYTVREELAELDAKIKETRKRIDFIDKLLSILK